MALPRPEYPRPQFRRDDWLCLNGPWQFEIDAADTGLQRGLLERPLSDEIIVPFCPESKLSGVEHTDFMNAVWYRREVTFPAEWAGKDIHLHFQAVDYDATVWVEGREVARHRGGFTPFACDLSGIVEPGQKASIVVRARDGRYPGAKPGGKQSWRYENWGCLYTRTTGIWQSVWAEPVGPVHLKRPRITPDVAGKCFHVDQPVTNSRRGTTLRATLRDADGAEVASACVPADCDFTPRVRLAIPDEHLHLWQPGEGYLYPLTLELLDADGALLDRAESYAGLRSVTIDGKAIRINGRSVFQRLVLDQGYYPDGLMTAPDDDALAADIELSMRAGFNGARLHQKVFEERFLYHADRLGYLVWGEYGDWGFRDGLVPDHRVHQPHAALLNQWIEVLGRDVSHPSIVGWCPINESGEAITDEIVALDDVTRGCFHATKAIDPTRPVLDASGYCHRVSETDVYDSHDYNQDPAVLVERHAGTANDDAFVNTEKDGQARSLPYRGQPYFVSEFGGIWWNPDAAKDAESWGYGNRPKDIEEFYARFEGLCAALLDNPGMFGYCYTQLTDVFQEQNGVVHFDRREKFDMARLAAAQAGPAAIERT